MSQFSCEINVNGLFTNFDSNLFCMVCASIYIDFSDRNCLCVCVCVHYLMTFQKVIHSVIKGERKLICQIFSGVFVCYVHQLEHAVRISKPTRTVFYLLWFLFELLSNQ